MAPGLARSGAFYAFVFCAFGAHMPFWPLWLADWGLGAAEIGALTSAAIAARVAMGVVVPWAADRAGAPRRALALLCFGTALFFFLHQFAGAKFWLYAVTFAAAAAIAGILPIADALTLRAAERGGFTFGAARGAGSAAFLLATLGCGWAVERFGSDAALWWIVLSFLAAIRFGWRHPGGAGVPLPQPKLREAAALVRGRAFFLTMLASSTLQGSHAVIYTYGSIHWRAQGVDDATIGALWAWSVFLEVLVMVFASRWMIRRFSPAGAMMLAGGAGLLRWLAMTADPGPLWLWPLQGLHALTFTAAFLGAVAMVERIAPPHVGATAQGFVGAMAGGAVMAGAGFAAAWAYPAIGAGAYAIGAALSFIGLAAAFALTRDSA